mmetsp:Transcript_27565/g.45565  ORF Transcript_27565/g.45565 Transcript_27565/m.45565 type:complete len:249 (-) Transcript_27565:1363-2109(-)
MDSISKYSTTNLTVTHAAAGANHGVAYFPKVQAGIEYHGMCTVGDQTTKRNCEEVPMYTVDSYIKEVVRDAPPVIDFLSVDVEGFDWDVLGLGGADSTLKRVKYLEFEYHSFGNWPKYTLENATNVLFEKFGMICYYAGIDELWRLTNCFQPYFNRHQWSNVACVNPTLDPLLASRMEDMFQRQLQTNTENEFCESCIWQWRIPCFQRRNYLLGQGMSLDDAKRLVAEQSERCRGLPNGTNIDSASNG